MWSSIFHKRNNSVKERGIEGEEKRDSASHDCGVESILVFSEKDNFR